MKIMILKKSIAFFSVLTLTFLMLSCEEDNSADNQLVNNYVGLELSKTVELADAETVTVEGRILASNVSGEDRTFNLVVDPSTTHGAANFSVPTSVTIPAGSKEGIYEVTIVGNSLVDGNQIVVTLAPSEDFNQTTFYGTYSNGVLTGAGTAKSTFVLFRPCADTRVRLSITFDRFPEETAWELYDADFNIIDFGGFDAAGGNFIGLAMFPDRSTFSVVKCLPSGDYTFVIYDQYGDGMNDGSTVEGSYSMNNLNNGAVLASGIGNFGADAVHEFTIQ